MSAVSSDAGCDSEEIERFDVIIVDLFTFGYGFKPWKGDPIASRQQILDYLGGAIEDANLGPHIRYGHKVQSAEWSSEAASWTLAVERSDIEGLVHLQGRFLWMCQGYYRHSHGYTPDWPGLAQFQGQVVQTISISAASR